MAPLVLAIQHSADDPPGRLGHWLIDAGCELRVIHCFLGEPLPASLTGYAGLLVLGGAMGAYDDAAYPWLAPAKALLREGVATALPTLGICLGHQLLAVACSGRVEVAATPQVGLVDVVALADAAGDLLVGDVSPTARAVHWNNDVVVQPPPGALVLSRSSAGIQAFRLGHLAWGVQFHPEVDVETVREWARSDVETGALTSEQAQSVLADVAAEDSQLQETWQAFTYRFALLLQGEQTRQGPFPQSLFSVAAEIDPGRARD